MARVRRRATAKTQLNLEIIGIAALGLAVLLGLALAMPTHTGTLGRQTAEMLHRFFGGGAPLFPVLIGLIGAIVFLEINVPRMIATLGLSALGYFLVISGAIGARGLQSGGLIGGNIWWSLRSLIGTVGAWIVLTLAALALTLWITNASLKKVIGWAVAAIRRIRLPRVALPRSEPVPIYDVAAPEPEPEAEAEALPAPREVAVPAVAVPEREPARPLTGRTREAAPAGAPYRLPDLSMFDPPVAKAGADANRAHVLEDTLASFDIGAKVVHIERGPSVTRYELRPERGIKISRIASLADDIALALAATSVRIEAPIPGKSAVGIEVPNTTVSIVAIRDILESMPSRGQIPPLWMAFGKDITGRPVFGDLCKMPHVLVAGATGSGKSVCLNTIIASVLVNATPDQVQMLMIDPKRVELVIYNGIPHLIKPVITDVRLAAGALFEMTKEMDSRYERFAKAGVRKIEEYNAKYPDERLPYVIVLIDELADLMFIAPQRVETTIMRLAQLARATGIHLIVSTQRPSVDVITGLIKANIPSRIAFAVSSQVDSRTILDMVGAERLLGRGDMLYLPIDAPKPVRAQGAFITQSEVTRLVDFWTKQARPVNLLDMEVTPIGDDDQESQRDIDPLCYEAARFIIERQYASTAQLQSQFAIGHPRAVRIMKQLEDRKVVGPHEGTKPRRILIGYPELEQIAPRLGKSAGQQPLFGTDD